MLSRVARRLATPILQKRAVAEVAAEGGAAYDVVLMTAWGAIMYNHYARGMDASGIFGLPVFFPFRSETTKFDYGGVKKIDNLFGQFQLPPPFSGW